MKTIYANSQEALNVKSMGLHHDHCHWYFSGHIKNLPLKFNRYRKGNMKYLLIYEEDVPN